MNDDSRKNENQYAKIRLFALADGEDWEEELDAWRHKAVPVYRLPQDHWGVFDDHRPGWIYFLPKTVPGEPTPGDLSFPEWVACRWDSQAGKWVITLNSGSSGDAHFMTPADGIAGMTGLQMNSASCIRYECSNAGLLSATKETDDVYNPVSGVIGGEKLIVASRNSAGLWVAIVEDCS